MKNAFIPRQVLFQVLLAVLMIFINACSEELVVPGSEKSGSEQRIAVRSEGPVSTELVKLKVSQRDNIPVEQITSCTYYGQTTLGYWEYHLTTLYNGPKIYTVTRIIGDDCEGA